MNRIEAFHYEVSPYISRLGRQTLIDCCAGDGRAGISFSGEFEKVIFVDIKQTNKFLRNIPGIRTPFEIFSEGIEKFEVPSSSAIIAIHACGIITDKILEKAVSHKLPVAVMPCCYNQNMKRYYLQNPPDNRKLTYSSEKDYYDAPRLQFLSEKGYHVTLRKIDKSITPMNNILIGIPS